jgi:predicted PurR-regulated permease PerM
MQTSVVALLFVTSAVILACIVVEFAVATFEQTLDTEDAPQIDRIRKMENMILNQTDNLFNEIESLNQTDTQQIDQILP